MRTIIMVKLVFCVLHVIILFSSGVRSGKINVHDGGFHVDEEGGRYLVETCTADGEIGDELSWYQTIGTENIRLSSIKHEDTIRKVMNITLHLSLVKEYNNTRIFCVKTMSRGERAWTHSDSILVTFAKANKPYVEPFVTVTPDTSPVYFDVNDTSKFFCNGSQPIDGRKLAWFIQGPGSVPVYAKGQIYDTLKNVTNLVLHLNESYNGTVLYCAQSYVLHYYDDQAKPYDEGKEWTVRSKNITLLQRIKEDKNENWSENKDDNRYEDKGPEGDPKGEFDAIDASYTEENKEDPQGGSSPLVYAIPIGVIALLLLILAAAVWFYRRRRAPVITPSNDENIYATPEVQYITLDFQSATKDASTRVYTPIQENSPYAKIIGVYKPNNTQKPQ